MTAPYYGKRELGAGTAGSPGDTLHFQFASYNDSGDSEATSGFAVTDIEVFKDGAATPRATDSGYSLISDTGQMGDRVGLMRFRIQLFNTADDANFYAQGSWYQVAVDAVTIDGKTVRQWTGSFEIGRQRVDVRELAGDTGAAAWLRQTFLGGFADTGVNERLGRIQSDVDTGLRVHIDDLDTGLHAHISDVDTGLHSILQSAGVNLAAVRGDTGAGQRFFRFLEKLDTGGDIAVPAAAVDTGAVANAVWNSQRSAHGDTGSFGEHLGGSLGQASVDTGVVNQAVWQADGARGITAITDTGLYDTLADLDTGTKQRLGQIQADVDTGLRAQISDLDTGLHDALADLDTGLRPLLALQDTGAVASAVWGFSARALTAFAHDTGVADSVWKYGDTGIRRVHATMLSDTGVNNRLAVIAADTDTGIQSSVHVSAISDTGLYDWLGRIFADTDTGLRSRLVGALNVDTYAEPGQGNPPSAPTIRQMQHYLYKAWRNKKEQTSGEQRLYADDGATIDQKASVSDTGGVATVGEMATGA